MYLLSASIKLHCTCLLMSSITPINTFKLITPAEFMLSLHRMSSTECSYSFLSSSNLSQCNIQCSTSSGNCHFMHSGDSFLSSLDL